MTTEQRAAVERLRVRGTTSCLTHDTDLAIVADLYLAEHPSDDDLPVTEEWLRSVGFGDDASGNWIEKPPLSYLLEDGDYRPENWDLFDNDIPRELQTRGDVRRLCSALGIALAATR